MLFSDSHRLTTWFRPGMCSEPVTSRTAPLVCCGEEKQQGRHIMRMTVLYDLGLSSHTRQYTRLLEPLRFLSGFSWGIAASVHQVEGRNTNNQWWVWEQQKHCWHGDVPGDACGWWRDVEGDLDRAATPGTNAHRMSIEKNWAISAIPGALSMNRRSMQRLVIFRASGLSDDTISCRRCGSLPV